MLKLNFIDLKWHVLAWACFITYEVGIVGAFSGFFGNFWDYAFHYIVHIAVFYVQAYVVLPLTLGYGKRHYFRLIICIIIELVACQYFKYDILWLLYVMHVEISPSFENHLNYILTDTFRAVTFIGYGTAYWFALTSINKRKQVAELELIKLNTELSNQRLESQLLTIENAYLKAQINPHFLFNTLNFLYNSVSKMNEKIADSVITLSEIMRYGLGESDEEGKVPLEWEIDHIKNFIKLNQARFNERLNVGFEISEIPGQIRIIPLTLMTLTENVFKYGDLFNSEIPAVIKISVSDNQLLFLTRNLKNKNNTQKGHGIGLKNIKERLALQDKFQLAVSDNEEIFQVLLTIDIT